MMDSIGDKIVCVCHHIDATYNKLYEITRESDISLLVYIINDRNKEGVYLKSDFISLEEYRNITIDKLLNIDI